MKKVLLVFVFALMLFAQSGVDNGYKGWAIGGGLSLAVPDDDQWQDYGYYQHFANTGVGPGFEVSSVIRFKIGKAGWVHYAPSVSWWGRRDSWGDGSQYTNVELADWKLSFNISDVRYSPPLKEDFVLRPYIGFGLFNFSLYYYKEDVGRSVYYSNGYVGSYYSSDTDMSLMQSIFIGTEFDTGGKVWPYVEFKGSNGNVGDFLATVGFTIQQK